MILQAVVYPTREMYAQSYAQIAPLTPPLGPVDDHSESGPTAGHTCGL
jgi:hypothetical protein